MALDMTKVKESERWRIDKDSAVFNSPTGEWVIAVGNFKNGDDWGLESQGKGSFAVYEYEGLKFTAEFKTFKDALRFAKWYQSTRERPTKKIFKKFNAVEFDGYEDTNPNQGDWN